MGGITETEALEVIRREFSHVSVLKLELVNDRDFGRIAKVHVSAADLEAALRNNGEQARRAAMLSGIDVEVEIAGN